MHIIKIAPFSNRAMVTVGDKEIPLAVFCAKLRIEKGLSKSKLEADAKISRPAYIRTEDGETDSLKVMAKALDTLGYDVVIKKREE